MTGSTCFWSGAWAWTATCRSGRRKNLTGISYDVDETDVVTRIMPTGEDADGNILYLPELYIDSPNIGAYTHPKWIHLAASEAKRWRKARTKALTACYAGHARGGKAEYEKGCDLPTVTLKVDFVNCADTEEYRQYAFLQNIFLGDSVRVVARRIGVEVSMRMTQYTYDCLTQKYTSVTLGTAADTLEGQHDLRPAAGQRLHHRHEAGAQLRGQRTAAKRFGRIAADQKRGHRRRAYPGRLHHPRPYRRRRSSIRSASMRSPP